MDQPIASSPPPPHGDWQAGDYHRPSAPLDFFNSDAGSSFGARVLVKKRIHTRRPARAERSSEQNPRVCGLVDVAGGWWRRGRRRGRRSGEEVRRDHAAHLVFFIGMHPTWPTAQVSHLWNAHKGCL